jgi:hypothetical protein
MERTLDALYIQPLVQILDGMNPKTAFTADAPQTNLSGVWDRDDFIALQFVVDIKTDGPTYVPPF